MKILVGLILAFTAACGTAVADSTPKVTADAGVVAVDASAPAQTGPTCTKGCPCGNSCISCSKTCHVGAGTAHRRR